MFRSIGELPLYLEDRHRGQSHVVVDDGEVIMPGSFETCVFSVVTWEWGVKAGQRFWNKHNGGGDV